MAIQILAYYNRANSIPESVELNDETIEVTISDLDSKIPVLPVWLVEPLTPIVLNGVTATNASTGKAYFVDGQKVSRGITLNAVIAQIKMLQTLCDGADVIITITNVGSLNKHLLRYLIGIKGTTTTFVDFPPTWESTLTNLRAAYPSYQRIHRLSAEEYQKQGGKRKAAASAITFSAGRMVEPEIQQEEEAAAAALAEIERPKRSNRSPKKKVEQVEQPDPVDELELDVEDEAELVVAPPKAPAKKRKAKKDEQPEDTTGESSEDSSEAPAPTPKKRKTVKKAAEVIEDHDGEGLIEAEREEAPAPKKRVRKTATKPVDEEKLQALKIKMSS